MHISAAHRSSVRVELFAQFSDCWKNWSAESVHSSQDQIYGGILAHFQSEWLSGIWKRVLIWTSSSSSLKRTSSKEWFVCEPDITPDCLSEALDYSNNAVNMLSFLHRLIVSLHKTSIYLQESLALICVAWCGVFFDSQVRSHWLAKSRVSAKNLLYCSTE